MRFDVLAFIIPVGLAIGCAQQREDAVAAMGKEVLFKVVSEAKLDTTTLSASGQAVNPEYEYDWFGGTGIYSKGKIRVVGVQLDARAAGAGTGGAVLDQDLRDKLYQIMMNRELSDTERKNRWNQTWTGAVSTWAAPTAPTTTTKPSQ